MPLRITGLIALSIGLACGTPALENHAERRVLVFSATTGFRHASIPDGIAAIGELGTEHGFLVDTTENAGTLTSSNLSRYDAVVFLSTTGDMLDDSAQSALQAYIRSGGGFVGVHAAADAEYDWPWYGELVGAWFASHPPVQPATIDVRPIEHPSVTGLPARWTRTDEWYDFQRDPTPFVTVLALLDETTYTGGQMDASHPVAWYRAFDGGRSWYTALGHTADSYAEPLFRAHLLGGIRWAAGW